MTTNQLPVVAITGATMGLGYALAQTLLSSGFAVSICGRDPARLDSALANLSDKGPVAGFTGDVADARFRTHFVTETLAAFGRIDGLVNNASVLGDLPMPQLLDTSVQNLRQVFEVNTFAPVLLLQSALRALSQQPRSVALAISSDAALGGYPGWGVYGASKAALDLLHLTLANEHSTRSTLFYSVDPSDMQTAMHEAASPGDSGLADPTDAAAVIAQLFHPLLTGASPVYESGCRLQVSGGTLVQKAGA